MRGVVRVENISNAEDHIEPILSRVKKEHMVKTYGISDWTSPVDFLDQLCRKTGRLLKGGEPDHGSVAKMILHDWIRGKIPYYVMPPESQKIQV